MDAPNHAHSTSTAPHPTSALELENQQLREQLHAAQLSMKQLGRTLQLSASDLRDSCSALFSEESGMPAIQLEGAGAGRTHTISQRRLALYLVRDYCSRDGRRGKDTGCGGWGG